MREFDMLMRSFCPANGPFRLVNENNSKAAHRYVFFGTSGKLNWVALIHWRRGASLEVNNKGGRSSPPKLMV